MPRSPACDVTLHADCSVQLSSYRMFIGPGPVQHSREAGAESITSVFCGECLGLEITCHSRRRRVAESIAGCRGRELQLKVDAILCFHEAHVSDAGHSSE